MATEEQLVQQINIELIAVKALLTSLKSENQALVENDIAAIERATADKQQAIIQQQAAVTSRQKMTRDTGVIGLHTLAETTGQKTLLEAQLEDISQIAHQCQILNRTNGKLIKQKSLHTQTALDILRQTDSGSPLYSRHGDASTAVKSSKFLGKA